MWPLVTVLIPAFNAEATIRRALDSALAQDYSAFEVLVVDDGSRDRTSEVVADYFEKGVRLLRLPRNRGEGGVLNEGIKVAKGDYIAFLDADDEWLPGKLSKQVARLEANPNATMATCGCLFVDVCGTVVEEFGMPPPGLAKNEIWRALLAATAIAKPCVVARAAALARVGPFDTTIPIAADQDMWIRLAMAGDVEFLPKYLTIAHDTPGSLTKVYVQHMERATFPMLFRHLETRKADLSREEVRAILCGRYQTVGRNLYIHGRPLRGLWLLLRSLLLGAPPGRTLQHLIASSPVARAAKRLFRDAPQRKEAGIPGYYGGSLLAPEPRDLAVLPAGPPTLIVAIDAEAEFDWSGPFRRTHTGVKNLRQLRLAQDIFDRFGVRPIYLVDYAVAAQRDGYEPLREIVAAGRCEIGAHLQAWETPPFEEELSERNSYNHNLPAWLQKEKLARLTETIIESFGIRPEAYRAGRYGIGEEMAWILAELGYRIDMSVRPGVDLRVLHAPDFRRAPARPYWFGEDRTLLEIPTTSALLGLFGSTEKFGTRLYDLLSRPDALKAHAPGFFARLGLLERVFLSPEGVSFPDMRRLTRVLLSRGHRVFVLSFHSSSLLPGSTKYVSSQNDLGHFLSQIEAFLEFFLGEAGGRTTTPSEFRATLMRPETAATVAPALSAAQ
jgi:glycosyltransferase involved in cell wall biosynthesis